MTDLGRLSSLIHDPDRLAVLEATGLLDSQPEETFDRLTRLACKILSVPVSLLSLVDRNRQFFKSYVGLPEPWATQRQTSLSHSFCQHVVATTQPLVVEDARQDPRVCDNLAVPDLEVIAYLGVPLVTRQQILGSFCVIDSQPRAWTPTEIEILSDLAASVATEIELRLLAQDLHQGYLQLRDLELSRDELVHFLVHDLRTPLTSLMAGLQLTLASPGLTPQHQRTLKLSVQSSRALMEMVDTILEVNKAEQHHLNLQLFQIWPHQLIEAAHHQVQQLAHATEVILTTQVSSELSPFWGDPDYLQRVLINLMGNAIRHTPRQGMVTLAVTPDPEDRLRFSISDTGCGIPKQLHGLIFDKYSQAQNQRFQGISGLGLSLCRKVIEAHGGQIWVESELGQGSTFLFQLPRIPACYLAN